MRAALVATGGGRRSRASPDVDGVEGDGGQLADGSVEGVRCRCGDRARRRWYHPTSSLRDASPCSTPVSSASPPPPPISLASPARSGFALKEGEWVSRDPRQSNFLLSLSSPGDCRRPNDLVLLEICRLGGHLPSSGSLLVQCATGWPTRASYHIVRNPFWFRGS